MSEKPKEPKDTQGGFAFRDVITDVFKKTSEMGKSWGLGQLPKVPGDQKELMRFWAQMWMQPMVFTQFWLEMTARYHREGMEWWQKMLQLPTSPSETNNEPIALKNDRRFQDEAWSKAPVFDFIKRSYLMVSDNLLKAAEATPLEGDAKERVQFYTQSFVDALSPSNFALTNPEVLQEAMQTGGQSLLQGLQNLVKDMRQGRITLTNEEEFAVGVNLATTPGAVVFQNRLFQLIQYKPTTTEVYRRPLLIIPPCINKYYVLDLKESNSFVKWLTEQGHTVFIMSWVNARPELRDLDWGDFVTEGVIKAIDVVREISTEETVNIVSWCIGGTITATALALMAKRNEHKVESVAFLTTLLDFSDPGQLKVFLRPQDVAKRKAYIAKEGFYSGKRMAMSFNMLRANDLIWSYVVNNYLKGKTPPPFDLLYWNSDPTNLPANMYTTYLEKMYLANKLMEKGGLVIDGEPIDLSLIDIPTYFLSAINDHIAPWKTTYTGAKMLSGPKTFVLGGSGHIAGVVNHPAKNKRGYWTHSQLPETPEEWLDRAEAHEGSWWPHWNEWSGSFGGGHIPAPTQLGNDTYQEIEPAPGSYVKVNCDGEIEA